MKGGQYKIHQPIQLKDTTVPWAVADTYSHLSNKCGAQAYRFWKIPPSTFIDSLDFSHPPLLVY